MWAEEISKWGNLIEEDGRLRAKRAPRERVLWSITTWEELFGEDEEEEMVRYAEKGEVSTLVLFNA